MARTSQPDRILSLGRAATADFAIRPCAGGHIQQLFGSLNVWFWAVLGHSPSSWLSRAVRSPSGIAWLLTISASKHAAT